MNIQKQLQYFERQNLAPGTNLGFFDGSSWFDFEQGFLTYSNSELTNRHIYYDLASITKTFTATNILIQAQKGNIDLDQPIQDFFTEFKIFPAIPIWKVMIFNSGLYKRRKYDKATEFQKSEVESLFREAVLNNEHDPEIVKYTDMGHYYLGKILELTLEQPLQQIIHSYLSEFDIPEITFLPLQNEISSLQIAPSEE
ncbi:MAG: hypothetical protein OHK0017_10170 [Patescibacteria group bacterium]